MWLDVAPRTHTKKAFVFKEIGPLAHNMITILSYMVNNIIIIIIKYFGGTCATI